MLGVRDLTLIMDEVRECEYCIAQRSTTEHRGIDDFCSHHKQMYKRYRRYLRSKIQ